MDNDLLMALALGVFFGIVTTNVYLEKKSRGDTALKRMFSEDGHRPRRFLVITAHPDDECMFFAPTIQVRAPHGAGREGSRRGRAESAQAGQETRVSERPPAAVRRA